MSYIITVMWILCGFHRNRHIFLFSSILVHLPCFFGRVQPLFFFSFSSVCPGRTRTRNSASETSQWTVSNNTIIHQIFRLYGYCMVLGKPTPETYTWSHRICIKNLHLSTPFKTYYVERLNENPQLVNRKLWLHPVHKVLNTINLLKWVLLYVPSLGYLCMFQM